MATDIKIKGPKTKAEQNKNVAKHNKSVSNSKFCVFQLSEGSCENVY